MNMTYEPKIGGAFVFNMADADGRVSQHRGTVIDIRARAIDPTTQAWLPITSPLQERIAFVAVLGDPCMHKVEIGSLRDQVVTGEAAPKSDEPPPRSRRQREPAEDPTSA